MGKQETCFIFSLHFSLLNYFNKVLYASKKAFALGGDVLLAGETAPALGGKGPCYVLGGKGTRLLTWTPALREETMEQSVLRVCVWGC